MLLPNNTKQLNENIAKNSEAINDIRADMSILNIENDKCKNDISEIKTELIKQKVSTNGDILKISDDVSKTATKVSDIESILFEVQSKFEKMQLEYETEKRNNEKRAIEFVQELKQLNRQEKFTLSTETKLKKENPELLTADEVCKSIGIVKLDSPTLKYYLYEEGVLDIRFYTSKTVFRVSKHPTAEIFRYLVVKSPCIFLFKPEFVDYLNEHIEELRASMQRHFNSDNAYKEAKLGLIAQSNRNYRETIHELCGIKGNYDGKKYGMIYEMYKNNVNKRARDDYNKYVTQNNLKNYSYLSYIIEQLHHGDILMKIACELFKKR